MRTHLCQPGGTAEAGEDGFPSLRRGSRGECKRSPQLRYLQTWLWIAENAFL
jgi:hypothetical protein